LASHLPRGAETLAAPALSILLDFFELNDIDDVSASSAHSGIRRTTQEEQLEGFAVKLMYTCIAWIDQGRRILMR
jgi:hypothetical protein